MAEQEQSAPRVLLGRLGFCDMSESFPRVNDGLALSLRW